MAADLGKGSIRGKAAVAVGNIHYGKGTDAGMRDARKYYQIAAAEGNVEGMNSLGLMIERDLGGKLDKSFQDEKGRSVREAMEVR